MRTPCILLFFEYRDSCGQLRPCVRQNSCGQLIFFVCLCTRHDSCGQGEQPGGMRKDFLILLWKGKCQKGGQIGYKKGDNGEMAIETAVSIKLKMGDDVSNVCFRQGNLSFTQS